MSATKEWAYETSGEADFDMAQARHLNVVLDTVFPKPEPVKLCEACEETVIDPKDHYCDPCWSGES